MWFIIILNSRLFKINMKHKQELCEKNSALLNVEKIQSINSLYKIIFIISLSEVSESLPKPIII